MHTIAICIKITVAHEISHSILYQNGIVKKFNISQGRLRRDSILRQLSSLIQVHPVARKQVSTGFFMLNSAEHEILTAHNLLE